MKILNDLHLGVRRVSGTTPESQQALRSYMFDQFKSLLNLGDDNELVILGDLFDGHTVPSADVWETVQHLSDWLRHDRTREVTLVAGNHDLSRDSGGFSSFDLLVNFLLMLHPRQTFALYEQGRVTEGVWTIPHLPNQAEFDAALAAVPRGTQWLLLHANFDNGFAEAADHSLNVSKAQLEALPRGCTALFAHEHQARSWRGHVMLGNQFSSSISDCLNNPGDLKRVFHITEGGLVEQVWQRVDQIYASCHWSELHTLPEEARFIRVHGKVSPEEAGEAVRAISNLRRSHAAFVVSNATEVVTEDVSDADIASLEAAKSFDVLSFLQENLDPAQFEVVKGLSHAI